MGIFDTLFGKSRKGSKTAEKQAEEPSRAPLFKSVPKRPGTLSDSTVLFVDDDPDLRIYVREELEEYAGKVLVAKDGVKALETLRSNEVDLVISDIMMPEMDGLTLCRSIKTDAALKSIPVILLSARADHKTMSDGASLGADNFVPKPFNIDDLVARMSEFFEGGRGAK